MQVGVAAGRSHVSDVLDHCICSLSGSRDAGGEL